MCGNTFEEDWTEEEAVAELQENFGDIPLAQCDVVCDDCYNKIQPDKNPAELATWQKARIAELESENESLKEQNDQLIFSTDLLVKELNELKKDINISP